MGRTNEPDPVDFEGLTLPTWRTVSEEDFKTLIETIEAYEAALIQAEKEQERLYKIESAALKVLGTMPRRNGKPFSFTMATLPAIEALDATLQQEENDDRD